jgi:hypothetical protein
MSRNRGLVGILIGLNSVFVHDSPARAEVVQRNSEKNNG